MTDQQEIDLGTMPAAPAPSVHDLECGCRVEVDPDGPTWAMVQCPRHAAESVQVEERIGRAMELDVLVAEAAGGKRVKRIMPADPYRKP